MIRTCTITNWDLAKQQQQLILDIQGVVSLTIFLSTISLVVVIYRIIRDISLDLLRPAATGFSLGINSQTETKLMV